MYIIFYLLGIGTLLPWNMFITAKDVSSVATGLFSDSCVINRSTRLKLLRLSLISYLAWPQLSLAVSVHTTVLRVVNISLSLSPQCSSV